MSDPHNARSQTGCVFLHGGTAFSWKSTKQTLVATSTNHSEIIALFEASRECVWLHRMMNFVQSSSGIGSLKSPTIIYEDNAACIAQMQTGYIKSNITKHISPKLFYPHDLQEKGEICYFFLIFPTGFLEGVFHGILYIFFSIFPTGFWRRIFQG